MAEAQDPQMEQEEGWDNEVDMLQNEVLYIPASTNSWYNNLKYYLTHGSSLNHLNAHKKRALRLKSSQYQLIDGVLFWQNYDQVLLRCLEKDDAKHILIELHDGPGGGHFSGETTAHKVLRVGYYWSTLFKDAHAHARKCEICEVNAGRKRRHAFPLHPISIENPFEQWGLDVVGEINPNSSKLHKYILTATDYFSKWTKAIPLKIVNDIEVIQFLQRNIVTRFGLPNCLVFDNAKYFSSLKIVEFALKYNINIKYLANYYPQGNGVAKSTNKNLLRIIKKIVVENQRDWHNALDTALWADRVTPQISLGTFPYFLVYGKEAILPPNIYLPSLQLAQSSRDRSSNVLQTQIDTLVKLKEERIKAKEKFHTHQQWIKRWFDKHVAGDKQFQIGDLVLKWDKASEAKGKHSKFQKLWLGPYEIAEKIGDATYRLHSLQGDLENLPVNSSVLKRYFS
jgi:hypothetical protein